ncbi:MAG: prolipoprotein diacylglyceryl transferase [Firmicutes bacterium]|nr:prolipoprotein diacylglyceryl transferase [Bacillota bacterium]
MNFLLASSFSWYGFLIGMAFIIAVAGGYFMLKYKKYNSEIIFDLVLICIPLAIIGIRLHFVIFDVLAYPTRTSNYPYHWIQYDTWIEAIGSRISYWFENGRIFGFDRGADGRLAFQGLSGLAIYGGLIAGALGAFLGKNLNNKKFKDKPHKQMSILQIYDVFFILIILGQVIGRWGNFDNVELYGQQITNPNNQWFPLAVVGRSGNYYQALFFYEAFFNLIGFAFMVWMFFSKRRSFDGFIFAFYCVWYGILRTVLEFFRQPNSIMRVWDGGPPVNVLISIGILLLGAGIIAMHIYKSKKAGKKLFLFVKHNDLSNAYYGYENTIEYLIKNAKKEKKSEETSRGGFSFAREKQPQTLVSADNINDISSDDKESESSDESQNKAEQDEFID